MVIELNVHYLKNMKKVGIHLVNDVITIRPSFHEKLEAWSGNRINESDYVVLPADSSPNRNRLRSSPGLESLQRLT